MAYCNSFSKKGWNEGYSWSAPWNIDNHRLILIPGSAHQLPYLAYFNWIECWIHFCSLPRYMVLEAIGRMLLMRPGVKSIHNRAMVHTDHRFYRKRVTINILEPLKKCMSLQVNPSLSYIGVIWYERLPATCYACGRIGHIQGSCFYHPQAVEIPYDKWIIAD